MGPKSMSNSNKREMTSQTRFGQHVNLTRNDHGQSGLCPPVFVVAQVLPPGPIPANRQQSRHVAKSMPNQHESHHERPTERKTAISKDRKGFCRQQLVWRRESLSTSVRQSVSSQACQPNKPTNQPTKNPVHYRNSQGPQNIIWE